MPWLESLDWEAYLHAITQPGRRIDFSSGSTAVLEMVDAGTLRLPSGRVSVREPYRPSDPELQSNLVFATVDPGSYPVQVVSAAFGSGDRRLLRGAAVRLRIGREQAVRWSPGTGDSLDTAGRFGVDGGIGILMDADNLSHLDEAELERQLRERWDPDQVFVGFPAAGERQAIAFDCGLGDGAYPVFLGFDSTGSLTELLVDLELCAWSSEWAVISDEPRP